MAEQKQLGDMLPEKLTPKQETLAKEYVAKWTEVQNNTESANRPEAEAAIRRIYKLAGHVAPTIEWANSPYEGALKVCEKLYGSQDVPEAKLREVLDSAGFGCHDAPWLAFFDFVDEVLQLGEYCQQALALCELAKHAGWWYPYINDDAEQPGLCVICERPEVFRLNKRNQLHATDGPALAYPGRVMEVYAVGGILVDKRLIMQPETVTREEIDAEQNVEVKRLLIQQYGPKLPLEKREHDYDGTGPYLLDSGAKVLDAVSPRDKKAPVGMLGARLLHMEVPGDEPISVLDLRNSTLEPDGSRKRYFIEVPPPGHEGKPMNTVREAVAWTFGMTADEYAPMAES